MPWLPAMRGASSQKKEVLSGALSWGCGRRGLLDEKYSLRGSARARSEVVLELEHHAVEALGRDPVYERLAHGNAAYLQNLLVAQVKEG
jgi:hypothetical protein